ncbi:MAG: HAD family hydrolase [Cellvibrionaceae bacterium]|nr:HAD family hydrolase [Cellvibrionaceae bacterium]
MKLKLICFDLDDTLWSTKQVMMDAETGVYGLLQEIAPKLTEQYGDVMSLFQARLGYWKAILAEQPQMRHQIGTMRRRSLAHLLGQVGYSETEASAISEKAFAEFMVLRHQPVYFDSALAVLKTLSTEYPLVAITNGNACSTRLGLDNYFSRHISAEALGVGKPEAAPFEAALDHFGVSPEQALHIGDHPHDDIYGAYAIGMHSLWFNRKGETWQEQDFRPSIEVTSLKQIPAAVQRLQRV